LLTCKGALELPRITVGDLVARSFLATGITDIYGIIGTSVVDFYDKLYNYRDQIRVHTTRHEQAAVSAADALYRTSGRIGAAVVHAGPGFLNSLIGIGIASKDRVPLVLVSGGVRRRLRGTDSWLEVDQANISDGLFRSYQVITTPSEAPEQILEALKSMYKPPMGPVGIEVAEDIWKLDVDVSKDFFDEVGKIKYEHGSVDDRDIRDAMDLLEGSEKPAILVCGETVLPPGFDQDKLMAIAEKYGAFILTTGNARGACDESRKGLCLGRVGFGGGSLPADKVLEETDALIVLGNEFDDITTYGYTLLPKGDILVFSRDPWVEKRPRYYDLVKADPILVLEKLYNSLSGTKINRENWIGRVEEYRKEWMSMIKDSIEKETELVNPNQFFHLADQVLGRNRVVTAGQGTHIVYTYNHLTITKPRQFLAATNLGAMGYALPAAIGACHGQPDADILVVAGDGEIMMVIQELETLVRLGCKPKIVVVNDDSYRVLYLRQVLQKQGRVMETLLGNPDYSMLAESFGIKGFTARNNDEARRALHLLEEEGPILIEIKVDKNELPPLNLDYTLKMNAV
jgi:acetolactate synthase-1/2/3 large subunit